MPSVVASIGKQTERIEDHKERGTFVNSDRSSDAKAHDGCGHQDGHDAKAYKDVLPDH